MNISHQQDNVSAGSFGLGMAALVESYHSMAPILEKIFVPAIVAFVSGAAYKVGTLIVEAMAVAWVKRSMKQ